MTGTNPRLAALDELVAQAQELGMGYGSTAQDTKVWAVCEHVRGGPCKRCPRHIEVEGHGRGTPGCYLHALRLVNIVERGKPR